MAKGWQAAATLQSRGAPLDARGVLSALFTLSLMLSPDYRSLLHTIQGNPKKAHGCGCPAPLT